MTSPFYGSRSYDWLNYPTYNWLFFRQDLDKIRDEENLTFSRRYFSFGSIIYNAQFSCFVVCGWNALDHGLNVSMEPFRAFVGDNLPEKQRTMGLPCKVFLSIGAYFASKLPFYLLRSSKIHL
jgi:hypothetical protein